MDAFNTLRKELERIRQTPLANFFTSDPRRASRFSFEGAGLTLDISKNHLTDNSVKLLVDWAEAQGVDSAIERLFAGEIVNTTESKAALHPLIRSKSASHPVAEAARNTRNEMASLSRAVQQGEQLGATGKPFTDVVNIGIGGSDLGSRMVCEALQPYAETRLRAHFISNLDPQDFFDTTKGLNPETTLFIVVSKSFGTQETLANFSLAKTWLAAANIDNWRLHAVAITSKRSVADEHGFLPEQVFLFDDAVGGRYSVWSSVSLCLMLTLGERVYSSFLEGAEAMDNHFKTTSLNNNLPVLLALVYAWYRNFWDREAHAILPYAHGLRTFPDYLQQLEMESLGKAVNLNGNKAVLQTGGAIWGAAGTVGQHSFFQFFHQGSNWISTDFVAVIKPVNGVAEDGHRQLLSHCIAQTRALMLGKTEEQARQEFLQKGCTEDEAIQLAPHAVHLGNRPSSTIVMDRLTPQSLGALMALYEHKVYVLAHLWNINPFDQWGVEYGKSVGKQVLSLLEGQPQPEGWDSSSMALINRYLDNN